MFGERRLSMNHWRYRLLHWTFNEKDVKTPEDSGLPKYLYSHYCPLFHLTNFIAIFAWLIFLCRVCFAVGRAVWENIPSVDFTWMKQKEKTEEKEESEAAKQARRKAQRKQFARAVKLAEAWNDVDYFLGKSKYDSSFDLLSEEEMRELISKVHESWQREEARKAKLRERLVFWANFSRAAFKWVFTIGYVVAVFAALWGAYSISRPIANFFVSVVNWLLSLEPMSAVPFIVFMLKIGGVFALIFGLIHLFNRYAIFGKIGRATKSAAMTCSPPFTLLRDIVLAIGRGIRSAGSAVVEFVQVFYEENCPPIVIVDEEDEAIDRVVEGGA